VTEGAKEGRGQGSVTEEGGMPKRCVTTPYDEGEKMVRRGAVGTVFRPGQPRIGVVKYMETGEGFIIYKSLCTRDTYRHIQTNAHHTTYTHTTHTHRHTHIAHYAMMRGPIPHPEARVSLWPKRVSEGGS